MRCDGQSAAAPSEIRCLGRIEGARAFDWYVSGDPLGTPDYEATLRLFGLLLEAAHYDRNVLIVQRPTGSPDTFDVSIYVRTARSGPYCSTTSAPVELVQCKGVAGNAGPTEAQCSAP